MLEKYYQFYTEKLTDEINDREKEFYEILIQISQKPTEENLTNLHHFIKRYTKAITIITKDSYCVDLLIVLLHLIISNKFKNVFQLNTQNSITVSMNETSSNTINKIKSVIYKILLQLSHSRECLDRMNELQLPFILIQSPSVQSIQLINKLLSQSSSFNIFITSAVSSNKPKFISEIMRMAASYYYPLSISTDKILLSSYNSLRYHSLTNAMKSFIGS